jgi:hypothetical protein
MKKAFIIISLFVLLAIPQISLAAPAKGFLDFLPAACIEKGNCSLDDVAQGFVLLTKWLIGSIGALALLYFIWGAIQWMTSYGNQEKIRHGREIMLNTVIALVVAFISFLLVEFFVNSFLLGGEESEHRVQSICSQAAMYANCNEVGQTNHVCSGHGFAEGLETYNGLCMSRCELEDIVDNALNWSCINRSSDTARNATDVENFCPNTEEVCVGS